MKLFRRSTEALVLPAPVGLDAKKWAQRANELQFTQLADVRSTAGNWRTGLTGLTSLLTVTSIAVAPSLADKLDAPWRIAAGALALAGLLVLLYGTWQAMSAAFGVPSEPMRMTAQRLRSWEAQQAIAGAAALRRARRATLGALALLIGSTGIVLGGTATVTQPPPLVRVDSGAGSFCGRLAGSDEGKVAIVGSDGTVHSIVVSTIAGIKPVSDC